MAPLRARLFLLKDGASVHLTQEQQRGQHCSVAHGGFAKPGRTAWEEQSDDSMEMFFTS